MHLISQLGRFLARLHTVQRHSQSSLRQFNTHTKFTHHPFSLNVIIPPSKKPQVVDFGNVKILSDFVERTYGGYLRGPGPDGTPRIILPNGYQNLSPSRVYRIVSPLFPMTEERDYQEVSDKTFEDRCHNALIKFLEDKESDFREVRPTVRKRGRSVAEWKGIFEMRSGEMLLLECKRCVTSVLYPIISNSNINLGDRH